VLTQHILKTKDVWDSGGKASCILDVVSIRRCLVSFMHWLLYPGIRAPGSQNQSGRGGGDFLVHTPRVILVEN